MKKITAIHIDDEIQSQEMLQIAAAGINQLDLQASFTSGKIALEWLSEHEADIVFVDVEMPEKNGIELALELCAYDVEVIFLTAHSDFAVKAFEACALDYLVKPIYLEKLQQSIERYVYRCSKRNTSPENNTVPDISIQVEELFRNFKRQEDYPQRIFVSQVGEIKILKLDELIYFGASGAYTKIYSKTGEVITSSESIKSYADILETHPDFARIHRSYLINKSAIVSIQRKAGNINVKMLNDEILPIAQHRRDEVFEKLKR
jgi:two-component system LytT family response regulator